jgi:hypothetical protein
MSENFEKNKNESGEAIPDSPEELEAAIEEETAVLAEQMEELESNLDSVDMDSLPEVDKGRVMQAFKQASDDINAISQTALAGGAAFIALGSLNAAITNVNYEQVQGFFQGGLASGALAGAIYAIGHAVNKFKRDQKLGNA